jgi:hypothetical protein
VRSVLSNRNASLGFYVPLRPLPYLSVMKTFGGFRFFDDDPGVHRKYFDGFDVPVEDFEDLKRAPVTHMIIMSLPHTQLIQHKLATHFGASIETAGLECILLGKKVHP